MRVSAVVVAVAIGGCGRIGFDPVAPDDAGIVLADAWVPIDPPVDAHVEEDAGTFEEIDAGSDAGVPVIDGGSCTVVMLRASECADPPRTTVASHSFSPARSVTIPLWLDVSDGNAGDHWTRLELERSDGSWISCCYQGGSSEGDPQSTVEIARGERYVYERCVDGERASCPSTRSRLAIVPSSSIEVTSARLRVFDGAPSYGVTEVEWSLEACR
ncbi:hypothetical protein [Sandaracinus amylolyticus]|uniref:Lipoprotein n=1 Tax=Sandaracinus amylolyticus TaxID=927083 RepID=A0A0F6YNH4_9BACT|nr:hypothetical protein [Sandaracinus amylolyticus]AKF11478.1 hypothetical protein DB32_008627 [Sandaracinus amylolyticus]